MVGRQFPSVRDEFRWSRMFLITIASVPPSDIMHSLLPLCLQLVSRFPLLVMSSSGAKPAAAYKNVIKGKLSLKGSKSTATVASGVKRKKDPEESDADRIAREDRELERLLAQKKENEAKAAAAAATSTQAGESSLDRDAAGVRSLIADIDNDSTLTKSERDFQRAQRERELETIQKKIAKTHRQRVEEYNTYLGNLSEHNDIPRVGPG